MGSGSGNYHLDSLPKLYRAQFAMLCWHHCVVAKLGGKLVHGMQHGCGKGTIGRQLHMLLE